jgi:hypothetical protein
LEASTVDAFLNQVNNLFPYPYEVSLEKTLYMLRLFNYDVQNVLNEIRPSRAPYPFAFKMEYAKNNYSQTAKEVEVKKRPKVVSEDAIDFYCDDKVMPIKKKAKKLTEDAKLAMLEAEFSPADLVTFYCFTQHF